MSSAGWHLRMAQPGRTRQKTSRYAGMSASRYVSSMARTHPESGSGPVDLALPLARLMFAGVPLPV